MKILYKFFKENIFLKRIYSIKSSIIAYSLASFLDIFIIIAISQIFSVISSNNFKGNIFLFIIFTFGLIIFRTISVYLLRRFSFNQIFNKKLVYERTFVENFIETRIRSGNNNGNDLGIFKEKLINSSNLATVNFDIPVFSIVAELIFAL